MPSAVSNYSGIYSGFQGELIGNSLPGLNPDELTTDMTRLAAAGCIFPTSNSRRSRFAVRLHCMHYASSVHHPPDRLSSLHAACSLAHLVVARAAKDLQSNNPKHQNSVACHMHGCTHTKPNACFTFDEPFDDAPI
jgi:hypothetical protein